MHIRTFAGIYAFILLINYYICPPEEAEDAMNMLLRQCEQRAENQE